MKRGEAKGRYKNIDEYIQMFPPDVQEKLQRIRETIKEAAPGAQEAISYGIPTFKLNGNLVHFAAYEGHIGFYPTSSGIAAFRSELSKYKMSKGTVQFPIDGQVPYDLVRRIVLFRANENKI